MNNYGFPTINLLKSTCFNRLLNNNSRSVVTISLDSEFHALITRTAKKCFLQFTRDGGRKSLNEWSSKHFNNFMGTKFTKVILQKRKKLPQFWGVVKPFNLQNCSLTVAVCRIWNVSLVDGWWCERLHMFQSAVRRLRLSNDSCGQHATLSPSLRA